MTTMTLNHTHSELLNLGMDADQAELLLGTAMKWESIRFETPDGTHYEIKYTGVQFGVPMFALTKAVL